MSFGRGFTLVAVIIGAVAIVLGVICAVITFRTRTFLAESSSASGQVIGIVLRESCDEDETGIGPAQPSTPRGYGSPPPMDGRSSSCQAQPATRRPITKATL